MLNSLAPQCEQHTIRASDAVAWQTTHIDLQSLPENRNETGDLHGTLKLAISARIMLVANIDVSMALLTEQEEKLSILSLTITTLLPVCLITSRLALRQSKQVITELSFLMQCLWVNMKSYFEHNANVALKSHDYSQLQFTFAS